MRSADQHAVIPKQSNLKECMTMKKQSSGRVLGRNLARNLARGLTNPEIESVGGGQHVFVPKGSACPPGTFDSHAGTSDHMLCDCDGHPIP